MILAWSLGFGRSCAGVDDDGDDDDVDDDDDDDSDGDDDDGDVVQVWCREVVGRPGHDLEDRGGVRKLRKVAPRNQVKAASRNRRTQSLPTYVLGLVGV